MLPNDNVSMSVGHLNHVLTVYSSMEHMTWKSPDPMCGEDPVSRFTHAGVFLIQSASLIRVVCPFASLSTTFALSQLMTWFSSTAWSVMADL